MGFKMSQQQQLYAFLCEEEAILNAICAVLLLQRRKKKKAKEHRKRTLWTRSWVLRRNDLGVYHRLMQELMSEDKSGFQNFMRLDPDMFLEVVERVGPRIAKQDTNWRKAIEPGLRIAITLRYLATGDSYKSLSYSFRVPNNTICGIIPETCEAIFQEYKDEVMACPQTADEWLQVSNQFAARWNLHNVIGALDGKHVSIRCPNNGGSLYYNYKGFHSIVVLALVDADYRFLFLDVGANGRCSDAGIFGESTLKEALENGCLNLPAPSPLPGDTAPIPFHIVGDDAFPLRSWLMKPFPKQNMNNKTRIFNYRLSRGRRVAENAFGILVHRFRCLLGTCQQEPKRVESIVLACCTLHNLMRHRCRRTQQVLLDQEEANTYTLVPGAWRREEALTSLEKMNGNNHTQAAKAQRVYLCEYYNSEAGSVPWQDQMI